MKIRLILLSLVGVAAYIVLANFNSKMIKETAVSKDHGHVSAPQTHTAKVAPPVAQKEAAPVPVEQAPPVASQELQQPQPTQQRASEPLPVQVTVAPAAVDCGEVQKLQGEIAQKDQQIRQLLDAQEAIAAKYRTLLAEKESGTVEVEAKDRLLKENADTIKVLSAAKEKTAAELTAAKAALEQLRLNLDQIRAAGAEAKDRIFKENAEQFKVLAADKEKTTAELMETKAVLGQLRQNLEETKSAGTKAEQLIQEKEALLKTVQAQVQELAGESSNLKAELAETIDKLTAAKAELEQAGHKAEALVRLSAEKEQQAATLNQQKEAIEKSLQEKTETLNKAIFTIQSLKQEVAAQPQAVATVQNLLDARNKEFDQLKKETAAQLEQLNKQVADLSKNETLAATERDRYKAEAETARKKIEDLEAFQSQAQTALPEIEKKLAEALESNQTLQNQLDDKEKALSGVQTKINELTTKISSLSDEKLGLTSQLVAMQADQKNLLAAKASFDEQAAALAQAEGKLKNLAVLQTKIEEMSKALDEKTAALNTAAKQGEELTALQAKHTELTKQSETSASAVKQLEAEKSDLMGQLAAAQAVVQNVDGLKKSLDEKSNALMLAETKVKDLAGVSEQIAALEAKLTAAMTAKQIAEKKVGEIETLVKNLNESLASSSSKVKALESELIAAQTRVKELTDKNQLQAQQDLVPNLNQQIATLRDQIAQMEAVSTQAKKSLTDATAAMQIKTEEAQAADKKMQALLAEKESLQQALNAHQATIGDLKKQLETVKAMPAAAALAPIPVGPAEKPAANNAADADKDGVNDIADLCPGSPAGTPVNSLGCPVKKGIVLEGVNFKSGTALLTPESQKKLDLTAAALKQVPQVKIEVAGYTDGVGDAKRNLNLSAQRSQAVIKYLTGKGVTAEQLTAKGYGPENPVADDGTPEGRQKNRRIELHPMAQ
ncbi:OmpA family protein [uncultured Desulfobulbus sp.]|uniref:OmpA family protein n=1 Tax=uncultured Desulfobulbus sp. TaxID=239745 RepID=UPI0029C756B3|nr:OmpA family protein [uncultured Desulfobulbus sp.]